ncbi:MAG: molybdate ABC transporter substrate-binding protein [Nitrospirales bacterium]
MDILQVVVSTNVRIIFGLNGHFEHLAIANPKTAPYGTAAKQVLKKLGLWDQLKNRLAQGENIGQTFQFVFSHNAQFGFVALAQVLDPKIKGAGSRWDVPENLHEPLTQHAVLLTNGQHRCGSGLSRFCQRPNGTSHHRTIGIWA